MIRKTLRGSQVAEGSQNCLLGRMAEQAAVLRCACGHGILGEMLREGERLGTVAFFDDEEASETHGERVQWCPGCGQRLEVQTLLAKTSQGL
jgi:hypothetical protein